MKKNHHSYPSFSAAAAFSVASASHDQANPMKLKKKSRLVSRGDGEDVEVAIHGSRAEEGTCEENHHTAVSAYFSGDVSINKADGVEPANESDPPTFDDWLDLPLDQLIRPEEISWTSYQMLNTPTPHTEEMQKFLDLDDEDIMASISSLIDK
jgi:hypothetical protein